MQKKHDIARVYATTIFNLAQQQQSIRYWKQLLQYLYNIMKNKMINNFFFYTCSLEDIFNIFYIIFDCPLNRYSKNFIKILLENKRFNLIKYILKIFMDLYNKYYNIIYIDVTTSIQIDKKKKNILLKFLEKKLCKKIYIRFQVKPSVLDGIIFRSQNIIIDDCVFSRLKALSNFLLN